MEKNKKHKSIECFNPDVMSLEKSYQDFLSEIKLFDAGDGYQNFNDFIIEEAEEYKEAGDGVTNLVWNVICDKNGNEVKREVVAFYTFAATAIPYEDRIRLDEDEAQITGQQYDIQICGISELEIKMQPLHCVDSEYKAMYLTLREVHMNYDE